MIVLYFVVGMTSATAKGRRILKNIGNFNLYCSGIAFVSVTIIIIGQLLLSFAIPAKVNLAI